MSGEREVLVREGEVLSDSEREDIRWLIRRSRENNRLKWDEGALRDERRCERLEEMLGRIENDRYITEPVRLSPAQRERNERIVLANLEREAQLSQPTKGAAK